MKTWMKCLLVSLVASSLTASSTYAVISVAFGTTGSSFVTDSSANYLVNDLVEVGTFATTPTVGSSSLADFSVFGTALTGTGIDAGAFFGFTSASDTGFVSNQIYLVVFNAATAVSATELGIAYVNKSSNIFPPRAWMFPASLDVPSTTTIDLNDLFASPGTNATLATGGTIMYGSAGFDPAGYSLLETAPLSEPSTVPEPSTYILVGTGLLGLLAFRRRN